MFTSRRCSRSRPPSIVLLSTVLTVVPFVSASPAWACPPQGPGAVPLSQGISELASQLAKAVPQGQQMTIAVTDFPDLNGQTCQLGRYVGERLSTLLSQHPQCRLIERRRLDMVLQELKFSMSELVDPAKARKLGQMLGVQGLVIGTVSDVGSTLDVDARIVDIQTDLSLPGASTSMVKDEAVKGLISECRGTTAARRGPIISPNGGEPKVVVKDFTFEVRSCALAGTKLNCILAITNGGPDAQLTAYAGRAEDPPTVRMVDDLGNEYGAESVQLGAYTTHHSILLGRGWDSVAATFASGVPMTARLTFEDISSAANAVSLLEVPFEVRVIDARFGFSAYTRGLRAQVRGVPISR